MINVFQPHVGKSELAAVGEVFASSWLGTGPRVERFEQAFAKYVECSAEVMLAMSSCTEALFHTMHALDLGPGDEVVMPTVSFVGAAHAVLDTGARVVLCDINPRTLNPSLGAVEAALSAATKAIVLLHYGGFAGEVAEIAELARERSVLLIEDAAISLGSRLDGVALGTLGDVGLWSFDSMKAMTSGDGGAVWCRDPLTCERIRKSAKLGLGPTGFWQRHDSTRWWEIDPPTVGRRATMNSIAAAIGLVQIEQLPAFLQRRDEIAATYDAELGEIPWLRVPPSPPTGTARSFYWIQLDPLLRDRLAKHLLEAGIYTTFKYWPLHRTHLYRTERDFPGADAAAASTLLLPLHHGLQDDEVARVLKGVGSFESHPSSR